MIESGLETRLASANNQDEGAIRGVLRGIVMLGIVRTRCGGAFGPELRASDRIFAARLHRRRGLERPDPRSCVLAGGVPGRPTDRWRVPLRHGHVVGGGNVREFGAVADHRLASPPNRSQASNLGLLETPIEPYGLRAARRVSLPLLPVQRQHLGRSGLRISPSADRGLPLVRRTGMDRCWISNRRSRALRNVAGHASQVLRSRIASACGER